MLAWFTGLSALAKVGVMVPVVGITAVAATPLIVCNDPVIYANQTYQKTIAFQKNITYDQNAGKDEIKVTKPGVAGSTNITDKVGKKCGKEVSRKQIKEVTIKQAIAQDEIDGTLDVTTEDITESLPFTTQNKPNASMDKGETRITQQGVNGSKIVTYHVYKNNGQEVRRVATSESLTSQPVAQIVEYGTKPALNCNPNYSPCVPNAGYDLDCPDIGMRVSVVGYDVYRLDADNDGIGCESY